jgi:hypothetical protein
VEDVLDTGLSTCLGIKTPVEVDECTLAVGRDKVDCGGESIAR